MADVTILIAAIAGGGIAAVTGFGIGSVLTPFLALDVGTRTAVALAAVPHLAATALRFWLLGTRPDPGVLWRFGIASGLGGVMGALLHGWARSPWLTVVFGVLLLLTCASELVPWASRIRFRGPWTWAAGALSGFLGGLAGNQGGIRSAALLGFELRRDVFVATATAIALVVDAVRLPFYVWTAHEAMVSEARLVATATIGVLLGTAGGARLLHGIRETTFRRVVATLVGGLGLFMAARGIGELAGH